MAGIFGRQPGHPAFILDIRIQRADPIHSRIVPPIPEIPKISVSSLCWAFQFPPARSVHLPNPPPLWRFPNFPPAFSSTNHSILPAEPPAFLFPTPLREGRCPAPAFQARPGWPGGSRRGWFLGPRRRVALLSGAPFAGALGMELRHGFRSRRWHGAGRSCPGRRGGGHRGFAVRA